LVLIGCSSEPTNSEGVEVLSNGGGTSAQGGVGATTVTAGGSNDDVSMGGAATVVPSSGNEQAGRGGQCADCNPIDPVEPVEPAPADAGCVSCERPDDEPSGRFELGFREDGEFVPLHDGSELAVISGFQGGTWTMPFVRDTGEPVAVQGSFELTSGGQVLGTNVEPELLWLEFPETGRLSHPLTIPVIPPTGDIADFYGQQGTLSATFTIGSEEESLTLQVILVEGVLEP
jgi:hypothetical protein